MKNIYIGIKVLVKWLAIGFAAVCLFISLVACSTNEVEELEPTEEPVAAVEVEEKTIIESVIETVSEISKDQKLSKKDSALVKDTTVTMFSEQVWGDSDVIVGVDGDLVTVSFIQSVEGLETYFTTDYGMLFTLQDAVDLNIGFEMVYVMVKDQINNDLVGISYRFYDNKSDYESGNTFALKELFKD